MDYFRENDILSYLKKYTQATNKQLCKELHCSVSTLRRSLISLEKKCLVQRVRGGALLKGAFNNDYSYSYRESINIPQKNIIAELAIDFIAPGMCIFLDSSSTSFQLIPFINNIPNLVVVTNGLHTALKLSESHNKTMDIYMVGGKIKNKANTVISNGSNSFIESFIFNVSFLSCRGLNIDGLYEANYDQAQIKKKIMEQSTQCIMLVDDSKFDSTHCFRIGSFSNYHALVTNTKPRETYFDICNDNSIFLIYPLVD